MPRACALPRAKEMEREAQRSGGIFLRSHSKGEMRWFHPVTRHSVPTLWPCGDLRASIICPSGLAPNVYGQDKGFWNHLTFPSLALRPNLSPLTLSPTPVFPANLSSSVSASAYLSPIFPSLSGPPECTWNPDSEAEVRISPSFFQVMTQVAAGILRLGAG